MDNSFINDVASIPLISRRDLVLIIIAGSVSVSLGMLLTNPVNPNFELAHLLNSVNIVGMTFASGLFSFLTAGLLFSSRTSRFYLQRRIDEVGVKRAYRIRVLHTLTITSFFTIIFTIIAFFLPIIIGIPTYSFLFLPSVLGASLIVSICLASIATALASITDDSRLCTIIGSASTIVIATIAGWSAEPLYWYYSLTRTLALLSPHNIVRSLAVQFSGYQFESTNDMVRYVGFIVSLEGLVVALLTLSSISIVLFFTGHRALSKNSTRWPILKGMIPKQESWDSSDSAEKLQEILHIRRRLRLQRSLTTMVVGVLLISMFVGASMYSTYLMNSTTIVHYTTPANRENIPVGSWVIFDVDVQPPYPGLFNQLFLECTIETLGNTSGTVSIYLGILEMNSAEFNLLEESIRFELVFGRLNQSSGTGFGLGETLDESYGSYVCVLKIISDAAPSETSYVEGYLQILQEAY